MISQLFALYFFQIFFALKPLCSGVRFKCTYKTWRIIDHFLTETEHLRKAEKKLLLRTFGTSSTITRVCGRDEISRQFELLSNDLWNYISPTKSPVVVLGSERGKRLCMSNGHLPSTTMSCSGLNDETLEFASLLKHQGTAKTMSS